MTPNPPDAPPPRRPRPTHRWSFERLESRVLPATATPAELAAAPAIAGGAATGYVSAGSRSLFRLDLPGEELLVATLHAPDAATRLILLDGQGRELTRSEGQSATLRDPLIAQHLSPGTDFLEVDGLAGAGGFALSAKPVGATVPDQPMLGSSGIITAPVVGDFNGDGRPDLVAAIAPVYDPERGIQVPGTGGVEVLLGAGDGSFGPPTITHLAGLGVTELAVGDFNGDGRPDLAAAYYSGGVAVLPGTGDGSFGPQTTYFAGTSVTEIAVGDFNGDGRPDLAVSITGYYDDAGQPVRGDVGVTVVLGAGDGSFGPPSTYLAGSYVTALVAGDFNGDGRPDLAAGTRDGVAVLLGSGDGSFGPPTTTYLAVDFFTVNLNVTEIAVADFNGDGRPDLAAAYSDGIAVLPGAGDGSFGPQTTYLAGSNVSAVAVGDFNGDGRPDLAATSSGVEVLLGAGDGSFGSSPTSLADLVANSVAVGDFNGDGRPDLATAFSSVGVLLGAGDGSFRPPTTYLAGSYVAAPAVGDFNGDGRPDLAAATRDGVAVVLGAGDGSFGPQTTYLAGYDVTALAVGDFNGDGRPDLVAGISGGVAVLLGTGDGSFGPPTSYLTVAFRFANSYVSKIAVGDFNGDGRPDLAAVNFFGELTVLMGTGDGSFRPPTTAYLAGSEVTALVVGDFNGDGRPDLAAAITPLYDTETRSFVPGTGGVAVLPGAGDGSFGLPTTTYLAGSGVTALAVGDFDGDGRPDLAAAITPLYDTETRSFVPGTGGVAVLPGAGDGSFGLPTTTYLAGSGVTALAVGDFDGDGRPDLAATSSGRIEVLPGAVDGSFRPPTTTYLAGSDITSMAVGDFNGDGRPDLATFQQLFASQQLLVNTGSGMFSSPRTLVAGVHSNPLVVDGYGDLAVLDQAGRILLRRSLPGLPGRYEPPIAINDGLPSLDITSLLTGGIAVIASVDARDNAVTLYRQEGPTFVRVGTLATGPLPAQVIAADLNGDGIPDLVVRNAGDGTASVFLGLAGGGFVARPSVGIGEGTSTIAAADLDGSGRPALVVTNQVTGDVRVFPNLGDGTFGPPARYHAGTRGSAQDPITGDLISDDQTVSVAIGPLAAGGAPGFFALDLGSNTLALLEGLGGGTIANARLLKSGGLADAIHSAKVIRLADLNGDGFSDLVLLGQGGVTVYLGDGRGGFVAKEPIDVGPFATGLTIADVDHDGRPDLLVGNTFGDILTLLGKGDGTFSPYRKADRGIALAVADLTGDGRKTFIYADEGLDRVVVQQPYGPMPLVVGGQEQGLVAPGAVSLADLNGDGIPDLIVANSGSNNVLVYLGLGHGKFGPAANGGHGFFTGANPVAVTVADVNGDGIPDLVVSNHGSNDVSVLFGRGRGSTWTLDPGPRLKAGSGPEATVVMDVNHDGKPDILVSDGLANRVKLLPGVGQGFFNDNAQATIDFPVGTNPGPIFVGNFTGGPGELDLITVNAGSNDLTLIRNFDLGGVAQAIPSRGFEPIAALAGDFNSDGRLDLLVANSGDGVLALFLGGLGELSFLGEMTDPAVPNPTALALDSLTGNVLQFYAGSEGREAATRLAFNLGGAGGAEGAGESIVATPDTPAATRQVARLQPLGGSSSLALVATLLTATEEGAEGEPPAAGASAVKATSAALPNQPILEVEDEEGDPEAEPDAPAPAAPAPPTASPLARFLFGLDEAFERARDDAARARRDPGGFGGASRALDGVLARWSPVLATLGAPAPALASGLSLAARMVDAALEAIAPGPEGPPRADAEGFATPAALDPFTSGLVGTIAGLAAVARAVVEAPRRRDRVESLPDSPAHGRLARLKPTRGR